MGWVQPISENSFLYFTPSLIENIFSTYHSGGGGSVPHYCHHIINVSRCWGGGGGGVRNRRVQCNRSPCKHYWESKSRDDDSRGKEPGKFSARVAGGVLAVSLGYEGGDGGEEIEDDHSEGVPITEKS